MDIIGLNDSISENNQNNSLMLGTPKNLFTQSFVALDINSSNGNVVDYGSTNVIGEENPFSSSGVVGYQTSRAMTSTAAQTHSKSFVVNPTSTNKVISVGRLEEDASNRISMPSFTTVKRKSKASASFRRLKITIVARGIQGLPLTDELLQLRLQDRSRETKSEGTFTTAAMVQQEPLNDQKPTIDLSSKRDDLRLEFHTIVSANVQKKVQLQVQSHETLENLYGTVINLHKVIEE